MTIILQSTATLLDYMNIAHCIISITTKFGIEVSGVREKHNRHFRRSQIIGLYIRTGIDVRTRKH